MPETPKPAEIASPAADLLSDLMRVVRLSGSVFWKQEFGAPFAVGSAGCATIAGLLGNSRPKHVSAFHLVAEGHCWLDVPGQARVALQQGDIMMLPYGDDHVIGNGEAPVVPAAQLVAAQSKEGVASSLRHGGDGETTLIVCGFVQSGDLFFSPVFKELPPVLIERTADEPVTSLLASTVRLLLLEMDGLRPGSREMLGRMMELLFFELLRRHVGRLPAGSSGWLGAIADPITSRALQRLHADPMRDWTVEQLAAEAGTSRSVLAERFKAILGQPPMQYLAAWRLQLASSLLREGSRSLAEVACEVGYESEAAFSRAFKRHIGAPPGVWRQTHAMARAG